MILVFVSYSAIDVLICALQYHAVL